MEMDVPTYMDRKQGGGSVVYKNYEYSKVLLNFRDQTRTNVFNFGIFIVLVDYAVLHLVKTRYRVLVLKNPPNYFNKILQLVKQKFVCRHFTMETDVPTYIDRKQGGGSVN